MRVRFWKSRIKPWKCFRLVSLNHRLPMKKGCFIVHILRFIKGWFPGKEFILHKDTHALVEKFISFMLLNFRKKLFGIFKEPSTVNGIFLFRFCCFIFLFSKKKYIYISSMFMYMNLILVFDKKKRNLVFHSYLYDTCLLSSCIWLVDLICST